MTVVAGTAQSSGETGSTGRSIATNGVVTMHVNKYALGVVGGAALEAETEALRCEIGASEPTEDNVPVKYYKDGATYAVYGSSSI